MPHHNELYEEYKDEGLVVLGICTANGQEKYAETIEKVGPQYPVARDAELKTIAPENGYVIKWYPTYVIVDKKGVVRASGVLNNDGIEEIIKTLLAEEVEEEGDDDAGGDDDGEGGGDDDGGMAGRVEIPADMLERRDDRESIQTMAGKPAPPLEVENWMNTDSPLDLADLRGKVVMLDYWATW